jgi:DNA adenine methylase
MSSSGGGGTKSLRYKCPRCLHEFSQIIHFNNHLARKKPCEAVETNNEIMTNQTIKPLLKYVGGKSQILKEVLGRFPIADKINTYYEPFVGGGSVLLGFIENNPDFKGKIVAADLNDHLIYFYKTIQTNVDGFLKEIKKLSDAYAAIKEVHGGDDAKKPENVEDALKSQEAFYYWQRFRYNSLTESAIKGPVGAALFMFLNRTCFRGLHRVGPRGFNVPFGNYKEPVIYEEEHVRTVSKLIQPVRFMCTDFRAILEMARVGDFVYMDPPYLPLIESEEDKKNSFVGYNEGGFSPLDHEELFDSCEGLTTAGIPWLMSNSDIDVLRGRFQRDPYVVTMIVCRRTINPKHPNSKENELLIEFRGLKHSSVGGT